MPVSLDRRDFLKAAGVALGGVALAPRLGFAHEGHSHLSAGLKAALATSRLVYVSPLHKDGRESTCHGEVWFTLDGESALMAVGKTSWKARAIEGGRAKARVWVGDLGTYKSAGEKIRELPTFDAQAERVSDAAVFERLMTSYAKKYPDEWGKWESRFRGGWNDGSRVLLRYSPL